MVSLLFSYNFTCLVEGNAFESRGWSGSGFWICCVDSAMWILERRNRFRARLAPPGVVQSRHRSCGWLKWLLWVLNVHGTVRQIFLPLMQKNLEPPTRWTFDIIHHLTRSLFMVQRDLGSLQGQRSSKSASVWTNETFVSSWTGEIKGCARGELDDVGCGCAPWLDCWSWWE